MSLAEANIQESDVALWIALNQIPGLGNAGVCQLLAKFGSPEAIFSAKTQQLREVVHRLDIEKCGVAHVRVRESRAENRRIGARDVVLDVRALLRPGGLQQRFRIRRAEYHACHGRVETEGLAASLVDFQQIATGDVGR